MPVWRSTFLKTSLYLKYLTYYHAHRAGFHKRAFNIANFRVLSVMKTPDRVRNAIAMIQKHIVPGGSNIFLFTDVETLQNASNVLAVEWITSKGQRVRLRD